MEENLIDEMAHELMEVMPQPEKEFVQAMMNIVERHGKLANDDGKGIWVGYTEASENEVSSRGIKCSNCAHYDDDDDGVCHIVLQTVEPGGLCRLAAIPDGIVRLNDMMS
jgi:hypothetical protein